MSPTLRIVALVALALLPSVVARAEYIYVSHLEVIACNEVGTCDWNVFCIPDGTDGPLTRGAVDTGGELPIHSRTGEFDSFPIDLSVWVSETDIGTFDQVDDLRLLGDLVGKRTVTIKEPGPRAVWISGDEGTVVLHVVAVSDEEKAAEERRYMGVFHHNLEPSELSTSFFGYDPTEMTLFRNVRNARDYLHVDGESYWTWEGRRHIGIFRPGSGGNHWVVGRTWDQFAGIIRILRDDYGMRPIDIDTFTEGSTRLYSGLFAPGENSIVWRSLTLQQLRLWTDALNEHGSALVDVEPWMINGEVRFTAVAHPGGAVGQSVAFGDDTDFLIEWVERTNAGQTLVDVETIMVGETRHYVGLFSHRPQGQAIITAQSYAQFVARTSQLREAGYELVDIEVYSGGIDDPIDQMSFPRKGIDAPASTANFDANEFAKLRQSLGSQRPTRDELAAATEVEITQNFRRGDVNNDAVVDMADTLSVLRYLFDKDGEPSCMAAVDANGDGAVDLSDGLTILDYLYIGNARLPAPGPRHCGPVPGAGLGCTRSRCASSRTALVGPSPEELVKVGFDTIGELPSTEVGEAVDPTPAPNPPVGENPGRKPPVGPTPVGDPAPGGFGVVDPRLRPIGKGLTLR